MDPFYRVGQAKKGGVGNTIVLLGREAEPEVGVLTSSKVALDRRHVHHQELVALLDGGVVGLDRMLGE